MGTELFFTPIRELAASIRQRKLSPVELTEACLDRSERLGPRFNAYVTLTRELALKQARQAESELRAGHDRGLLHGIPYAAKDLVAVRGYKTTWGARPYANQEFDYDAAIFERLSAAGAVLIGKAAMIELAGGLGYTTGAASFTGPCRNPWNPDCWTCGSSSGSGAVVAAGLAPWAIGSDTRGSILCPSSWCGISGLRPSFGRVSRRGAMAIAWSMDKLGPMARCADDCGIILSVIAGHDPLDHDSLPFGIAEFHYAGPKSSLAGFRVGRLTNSWNEMEPGLAESVDDACRVLEKTGASVKDAAIPDGPFEEAAELTILMEATAAFDDLIQSGRCSELNDPLGQVNGYASRQFSAYDYVQVQRVRAHLQKRIDKLFDHFDVIVSAAQSSAAKPLGGNSDKEEREEESRAINQKAPDGISSLCGLPSISVPCGFSKSHLPFGLQFSARALNDEAVIRAAHVFQSHTDWHRQRPPHLD